MKNSLGIYFGSKVIDIVEVKGKKIIKNIRIPTSTLSNVQAEDRVPEELKLIALLKDELRKNKIECKEVVIGLSAIDLIIRTFEIPIVSSTERSTAIGLEVKKYIPFKMEDLVSDFQFHLDSANRRYLVLFAGIIKENLEKYISILKQLNIKIKSIEYSAFSMIRLVGLTGLDEKGIVGIINMDAQEEGNAEFTVIEGGIPLFSRDIKLAIEQPNIPGAAPETTETNYGILLEKLKTEIRISLDYYKRKFPTKQFNQIYFIGSPDCFSNIQSFVQELDLSLRQVDADKYITDKSLVYNLSFLKAYCAGLQPAVKTNVKLNILSAWEKSKQSKEAGQQTVLSLNSIQDILRLISPKVIVLIILLCSGAFGLGIYKKFPLQKEIDSIIATRPIISNVNNLAEENELTQIEQEYNRNIGIVNRLLKEQVFLTPRLSVIASILPEGMWLFDLKFNSKSGMGFLKMEGFVYLGDKNEEVETINNFLLDLKESDVFKQNADEIIIDSIEAQVISEKEVTQFIISIGKVD